MQTASNKLQCTEEEVPVGKLTVISEGFSSQIYNMSNLISYIESSLERLSSEETSIKNDGKGVLDNKVPYDVVAKLMDNQRGFEEIYRRLEKVSAKLAQLV